MNPMANNKQEEIERYESYIKFDPNNTLLWIQLGDLYHESGKLDEAVACFEKCLILEENNEIAKSRLANVLVTQHRFGEAEKTLSSLLEKHPDDPALLHNYGLALFYQTNFKDAQQIFEKARLAGSDSPQTLAYIVFSLHKQTETEQALEVAQQWLEESPGPVTEGYVSMLEMDNGDMEQAKIRAETVLQNDPQNPDANVVLGNWSVEQHNIDQAIPHFKAAIEAEPGNPRGWQGLGLTHLYRQENDEAIAAIEKALELMPDYAVNHLIIGWARLANQDAIGAEAAFRKSIECNRGYGEGHGGLAAALVLQNRLDEGRKQIKRALGLDPTSFGAIFAQSVTMTLKGKEEQGTKLLSKALMQQPVDRSKPVIEHIQEYLRNQGHNSTKPPAGGKGGADNKGPSQ